MAAVEPGVGSGALEVSAPGEVEVDRFGKPVDLDVVVELTPDQRVAFVEYVRANKGCSVKAACEAVRVRRRDVRALRKLDSEFAEDYADARGYGSEQILGGMVKLALEGVEEPVVSAGKLVLGGDGEPLTIRRYDSRALIALFNGMTPEGKSMMAGKLGIEITGADGGPIKVQSGVSLESVAQVLLSAGVDLGGLAARSRADEIEGELVGEEDEPA